MDITGWISDLFGQLGDLLNELFYVILSILPDSPFQGLLEVIPPEVQKLLGYINYVLPISFMVDVFVAWTIAISFYYAYMVALRWLKAVN